ncbi:protein unc-80 homolog [Parasteatoda tepidariorum]|uniref:protein unc-80 homolog n=1 Tax=Parasteatoda tepidariorum TaxID=114398 RepID=UPI001C71868B|nr:protein unc-80 homolog [Parasteatoda tepidariorum]
MPKRRYDEDPEGLSVPLPIQNFLWRQTSPFIRPKYGKLHEASCMEQREACKSFEKVLVQNIQFGLSPSLTQAIKSISRWRLIQAAFPHVMHCCAALLYRRKDRCLDKLGTAETKLLYTLQWIILDAIEECADAEAEQGFYHPPSHYLFPISSIQVFVYLFAPLGDFLRHSDFMTSFRLENGLKLWESLWEYRHPNVACFTTHVLPKRTFLKGRREKQTATKFGDVFIGGGAAKRLSKDQCTTSVDSSDTGPTVTSPASTGSENKGETESDKSSPKELEPKKDDFFCELCSTPAVKLKDDSNVIKCSCGNISIHDTPDVKLPETALESALKCTPLKTEKIDIAMATYLDVAVLRCLFISQWLEEGIFWALKYLFQRLKEIKELSSDVSCIRKRSFSLPIPEIEISLYQSPEQNKKEYTPSGLENIFTVDNSYQPPSHHTSMHELHQTTFDIPQEKQRSKRMKVSDFKSFVEEKLLDRASGNYSSSPPEAPGVSVSEPYHGSGFKSCLSSEHLEMQRPKSALAMLDHKHSEDTDSAEMIKVEMVRGRSMPSLHHYGEHKFDSIPTSVIHQPLSLGVKKMPAYHTFSVPNPIITVTEHSPVASVQFFLNQDSVNGQNDSSPPATPNPSNQHFTITRSQTDSNIKYDSESSCEATGSTYYITSDGEINLEVVLKAVHSVTLGDSALSLRVCEIALNLLDLLLSFGIITKQSEKERDQIDKSEEALISTPGTDISTMNQSEKSKSSFDKKKDELTLHHLFMDSLWRICKYLGCPLSCQEGHRSRPTAELLRMQILNAFNGLFEADKQQFRSFLREVINSRPLTEVIDFFHSFVGFCMESGSPVSPLNQKRASTSGSQENNSRHSYANNFGAGFGKPISRDAESLVIQNSFKAVVSRLVVARKDLKSQENLSLYRNIRQFMAYVREYHGGVFRRVALSGLLDSAERPHKKNKSTIATTRIVRHTKSVDHDDYREAFSPTVVLVDETALSKSTRKSFFRKRGVRKVPSAQSVFDDREDLSSCPSPAPGQVAPPLLRCEKMGTPRLSVSDDENLSLQPTPKHKSNRFQIVNWLKGDKMKQNDFSLCEDDNNFPSALLEGYSLPEKLSRGSSIISRTPKLSQKSSSHVGVTLSKAKKRMEDHLTKIGFGRNKNKHGSFEEPLDISRRNSCDFDHGLKEGEFLVAKESKLVNITAVKDGMMRLSFQMEACLPGTTPDPPLLAAALDLKAPVVARAALYLECAHFVHRCNKGCWPTWMRTNLPIIRTSNPHANRITHADLRRTDALQKASGKLFYQWAEAIGYRLEELLEKNDKEQGLSTNDENKKRQLRLEDEEEDFLDEACVNPGGSDCPFALQVAACQLLLEITAFMRETYQYLPHKGGRLMSMRDKPMFEPRSTTNRRWSMALSSVGSISEPQIGERRISFLLQQDTDKYIDFDGESENSSNTTLTVQEEEDKKGRRLTGRPRLLRRGLGSSAGNSSSFKRRSLKLKKPSERRSRARSSTFAEDEEDIASMLQRTDSIRSKRKVSAVSDRSDTSDKVDLSGEESPGVLSDDLAPESPPDVPESDDTMLTKNFPWLKVLVKVLKSLNYDCQHQYFCPSNCYRRQMRSCNRLVNAVRKVYGDTFGMMVDAEKQEEDKGELKKEKKIKKIITAPSSPLRRKASVAHIDKLERPSDVPHLAAFRSLHSSTTFLAHDIEAGIHLKEAEGKVQPPGNGKDKSKSKEELSVLKYIKSQVKSLFHCSISTIIKGAVVLPEELFTEIMSVSWELLLEWDYQLTASAAVAFILASVKAPEFATQLLKNELKHDDPTHRVNAILKFQVLWRNRYQCWPRMEDGAHITFKVPPPNIEFTLPSPKIASDHVPVADTPWMPQVKAKVQEVTINQEQALQRSFVTATKTRRKQQMESVQRALQNEEEKKRTERQNYHITTAAATLQAAYEPALFHSIEDHEEDQDLSIERNITHHIQAAQALFPSCLCSAAIPIIESLEDAQVNSEAISVHEAALKVTYLCLIEDTALFLRHILEKLTRERQNEMFQILRKLLRFIPQLPPQSACALYNYLIGYVMFYVRAPVEGGQDHIGNALSVLWQVAPSVNGLFLKDLKQVLRKEQCDATLLITANVPSAKKIIIHGPDASGIPSQYPIHEDTQFSLILQDSLDFFSIEENQQNSYFLVDTKTNMMHCPESYVRDFYFFKRSQYPQLSLVHINPDSAFELMQSQSFKLRFLELGKVLMSLAISKSNTQVAQRVFFLHEELMKLPSFPRKALECDFNLYAGILGKEMLNMDTLHKLVWVKLVARMFEAMAGLFVHSSDIHLFLNVINGALVLHPEDAMILRFCMSTFMNAALQFKNIFASNGYLLIMPTILRTYSNHQTNNLLCRTLEFVCKQFYILHRKPFILQMFGSAAPILDMDVQSSYGDASKVQPKAFFQLLQSLEQYVVDPLDILELVDCEKPLRALDFCYQNDPDTLSILDAISLCITVVAYAADSQRGHQMLTILEAILPFYLRHLQNLTTKKETPGGSRSELSMIHNISICMKTLISNCEALARNYTGPQRTTDLRGSSIKNMSRGAYSPPYEVDDDSQSKFMTDSYYSSRKPLTQPQYDRPAGDTDIMKTEFRRPRDILLSVVSEFLTICSARLAELAKIIKDLSSKATELLDQKCHFRLAEVAHSLLKFAPYDPITMSCRGLQRYMNEVLPHSEWAQETMRPALIMVLRRIDKTFNKIAKKPAIRRSTDWNAARSLLKGVYLTLYRHPYIVHLPHLKSLVSCCQSIILGDQSTLAESSSNLPSSSSVMNQSPPPGFCSVVVRLIAMQMIALGESQSLETVCGGTSAFSSPEKLEIYLMNLILPLCIRISSSIKDVPKLRHNDIAFALTMVLHALAPVSPQSSSSAKGASDSSNFGKSPNRSKMFLFHIGFVGLKVLLVCFEKQLSNDWHRIAGCIRELGNRMQGGLGLWNFIDFIVSHRTPLYVLLYPMIKCRMLNTICDNEQEYSFQQRIKGKLNGQNLPVAKSHGALYVNMVQELKSLKEDLISWKIGGGKVERLKSTVSTDHSSDTSQQAGFLYQMSRKSEHSGLNDPSDKPDITVEIPVPVSRKASTPLIRGMSTDSSLHPQITEGETSTFTNIGKHIHKGLSIKFSSGSGSRQVLRQLLRRSSYPYPEDDSSTAEEGLSGKLPAVSEPRLWRKSTFHMKRGGSKKGKVGSGSSLTSVGTTRQTEEQDSPGDQTDSVSQPPSCPTSPVGGVQSPDPDSDTHLPRHRLQRQKAPSRKTFRYRKSHRGAGWAAHTEADEESGGESIAMMPTKTQLPLTEEDNPNVLPQVAFIQKHNRHKIVGHVGSEESPVGRRAKRHHGKKRYRSHSQSPTSPLSPEDAQTLGDSVESLGNGEKSTLLQESQNQNEESETSLFMVFPDKDNDNTCV